MPSFRMIQLRPLVSQTSDMCCRAPRLEAEPKLDFEAISAHVLHRLPVPAGEPPTASGGGGGGEDDDEDLIMISDDPTEASGAASPAASSQGEEGERTAGVTRRRPTAGTKMIKNMRCASWPCTPALTGNSACF